MTLVLDAVIRSSIARTRSEAPMSKKNEELAKKSAADLKAEEAKMRKEIFDLQFKHSTRQLNDTMADLDPHGVERHITKQQLRWFVELEALAGQESAERE